MPHTKQPPEITQTISIIRNVLKNQPLVTNPVVPELSFKPHFMVRFDNQLVFIEIASPKTENIDWKTLRLIEHLFEIKMFCGERTAFNLVLINRKGWKGYCLQLLERFFDKVIDVELITEANVLFSRPNDNNYPLWYQERKFERYCYKEFTLDYLNRFTYNENPKSAICTEIYNFLRDRDPDARVNYSVRNFKNYYLDHGYNLKFYFDFFSKGDLLEVASFKSINEEILQNLMIKSRLIRYSKQGNEIILSTPRDVRRLILVINGNISGPVYDKFRYLRMLTNAGWYVLPLTDVWSFIGGNQ